MTTKRYCIFLIPAAHKRVANLVMAFVNGDNPNDSTSFRVAANPSGLSADPTTHYYGGMSVTEEWLNQVSNLATDMIELPNDAIWADYNTTETETIAAAEAMHLQVTITQDGTEPNPQLTRDNALAALGLKMVEVF